MSWYQTESSNFLYLHACIPHAYMEKMYGNGCTVHDGKGETCMHFCHYDFCNQDHIFYDSEFTNSFRKLIIYIPLLFYCLVWLLRNTVNTPIKRPLYFSFLLSCPLVEGLLIGVLAVEESILCVYNVHFAIFKSRFLSF